MEIRKEVVPVNERLRTCALEEPTLWNIRDEECLFGGAYGDYFMVEFSKAYDELRSPLVIPSPPFYVSIVSSAQYRARRAIVIVNQEPIEWILVRVPARIDSSILLWLGRPEELFKEEGITIHERDQGEKVP